MYFGGVLHFSSYPRPQQVSRMNKVPAVTPLSAYQTATAKEGA
jgi:hypothetical protein